MATALTNCRDCACPLICLHGESRRLCVRCLKPHHTAAKNRAQYLARREERCAANKVRYAQNREARLAKAREYYQANKATILAKKRQRELAEAGVTT